jgi:hypothetical protein
VLFSWWHGKSTEILVAAEISSLRMYRVILDDLGYLPLRQAGGALTGQALSYTL